MSVLESEQEVSLTPALVRLTLRVPRRLGIRCVTIEFFDQAGRLGRKVEEA